MKKKKYFCVCLSVALATLLATCTYNEWQNTENAVFAAETKAFFEKQTMFMGETNSNKELHSFGYIPVFVCRRIETELKNNVRFNDFIII